MSFIMPLFFGIVVLILHTVFYYHDRVVLIGAAAETAVVGTQEERRKDSGFEAEKFFADRTKNKLIWMTEPEISVDTGKDRITVTVSATKSFMKLSVSQTARIVTPEKKIRRMR